MAISHVIIWAYQNQSFTEFNGEISVSQAAIEFEAKPASGGAQGFSTELPAFQVLNRFSKLGYSMLGMSGTDGITTWVMGKPE